MARPISNDLNSPVSLLWAHQLRREHAQVITELQQLKSLHPSASELKKFVTRNEKAEAASKQIRKELTELRNAHQKNVKVTEALEKELNARERAYGEDSAARKKQEESVRVEIKRLGERLARQEDELTGIAEAVQKVQCHAEEGNVAIEHELAEKEDAIVELRGLLRALEQRVGDAVTVIKDSVECCKETEASTLPQLEDVSTSDADPFDLDANVQAVAPATPSGPILGPSLAMIKEPTLRCSQRLKSPAPHSLDESMEVLSEPSLPPLPGQCQPKLKSKPTPRAAMPKQATNPNLNLAQGKTKLSTYIQVADIKYQETQPDEDAQFVDAFVHGLTDKRNRKTCEKKFKEEKKTWKHLKECFPVASQQSQGDGANQGKERGKQVAVDDTAQMQNITPRLRRPPRTREDMEIEKKLREEGRERCQHHRPSTSRQWKGDEINIRHIQEKELGGSDPGARRHATPAPPPSKENRENEKRRGKVERADLQKLLTPVKQAKQAKPDDRGTKRAPESQTGAILPKRTEERAPSPHAPRAVRKRPLGEQNQTQGNIQQAAILPPAKKKKKEMKKKVIAAARKPERTRAPSIPILPSSDDEFA